MKNNRLRRLCAGVLACLMLVGLLPISGVFAAGEIERIHTTQDFLDFAANCTLDSWSVGKMVILEADISLENTDFEPIPTFSGTLDGAGHTISGLNADGSYAPAGLISILESGGAVKNLKVEGTIAPEGEKRSLGGIVGENHGTIENCTFTGSVSGTRNVGGIAGFNTATGIIRSCTTSGAAFGVNMTGGIVGYNLGLVDSCENGIYVNIESADPEVSLDDLNLDLSLDLSKLSQPDTANIATDTGGVAGYSSGTIRDCVNRAAVGHQHIGYNVGGIAGRSDGQIKDCANEGDICGRKDVGGIVGQMEPYVQASLSESLMSQLRTKLDELSDLVDKASNDAEGSAGGVGARLNQVSSSVSNAVNEAGKVKVNASVDSTVNGSGTVNGNTSANGQGGAGVAAGEGGGVHVGVETKPGSTTIEVGGGSAAGVGVGGSGQVEIDHTGEGSGTIDASTQIVAAPDLGGLTSAVSGISGQIAMLNSAVNGMVGTVAQDVRAINSKFGEISDLLFDAMEEAQSGQSDLITDGSQIDVDQITFGKVSGSRNSGTVYGDLNAGGVAGSMALEYALDPEDDVSNQVSGEYRRQYEYKAVIQGCVNTGAVTGKRSYVGGVCGRMDLGLITGAEGYGIVSSESGSYVGGIAGLTAATVRESYAKCALSGNRYVGGIVGSGVTETVSGTSSTVAGCYSIVEITDSRQYSGAVSGGDAGSFLENYFVSDTLAGINRQSYTGKAEPVSYLTLQSAAAMPKSMRSFTLTFTADGKTLDTRTFQYGASFDESDFPELPQKEGDYARWDKTELKELHLDTTVTAVYTPYTPGLASNMTREDGRAIFLLEGDYDDQAELEVTPEALTPSAFVTNTLGDYFSCFREGKLPPMTINREVVEQWSVQVSPSQGDTHALRYLAPEGASSRLRIYTQRDGRWVKTAYESVGSYLIFTVQGSDARIAVVSAFPVWWIWLLALLAVAGLIVLIVILVHRSKKNAKARRAAKTAPEAAAEAAAQTQPQGERADAELLARALSAEERLAKAEEELRALRESAASPAEPVRKPKRKKRWWILILVLVLLLAAGIAVFFLNSGLRDGLEAYRLLSAYSQREPMTMELAVSAGLDGKSLETTASVCRSESGGTAVTAVELQGVPLYYANGNLYLENGRAYGISDLFPDYASLIDRAVDLYRLVRVDVSESGGQKVYRLTAKEGRAKELLEILLPDEADALGEKPMEVTLTAEDGTLTQMAFSVGSAGSKGLYLDARAELNTDMRAPELPEAVSQAISAGTAPEGKLTEDAFEVLLAWKELLGREKLSADVTLSVDCGPVVVNDTLEYDRLLSDGESLGAVRKGSVALYFSGDRFCDATGHAVSAGSKSLLDASKLMDLVYKLILNGTVSCQTNGKTQVATLSLGEDGMSSLAQTIAPDIQGQDVRFTDGSIVLTLKDGVLQTIRISCAGSVHIVLADVDVSVRCEIAAADRDVTFPQTVLDALKK